MASPMTIRSAATGMAEANSTVKVYDSGATLLGSVTANGTGAATALLPRSAMAPTA